jgi:C4-dicarboxylate transporter DctM subunit
MTGYPLERVVKATIPFMLSMLVFLLVITFVPTISTILPELLSNTK